MNRRTFLQTSALAACGLVLRRNARAQKARVKFSMLNSMAGSDFEKAAERHVALGLQGLDIKDGLWGETINNVSFENAQRAAEIARAHGLAIYNFSTALCHSNLADGETAFRKKHLATLDHVLKIAAILKPESIRLISATLKPFPVGEPVMAVVEREHSWVFGVYAEMVDRMVAAGVRVLIENETPGVIFNAPAGVVRFFERLDRAGRAHFTWDVQNFWQMGVLPTMEVYRTLKPLMGCLHLKGGRSDDGQTLKWASALEDASWPVREIVRTTVTDGVAPVICLNPSHGEKPPGYNGTAVLEKDLAFLRRELADFL